MNDLISRQAAIDALNDGAEFLRRVLDEADIVGAERAKYEWGLGLIKSYIYDMKELPSAQPEVLAHGEGELSAQPEITRCHECAKLRTLDCPMGITVFDAPSSDGYCYKAERRNDGRSNQQTVGD